MDLVTRRFLAVATAARIARKASPRSSLATRLRPGSGPALNQAPGDVRANEWRRVYARLRAAAVRRLYRRARGLRPPARLLGTRTARRDDGLARRAPRSCARCRPRRASRNRLLSGATVAPRTHVRFDAGPSVSPSPSARQELGSYLPFIRRAGDVTWLASTFSTCATDPRGRYSIDECSLVGASSSRAHGGTGAGRHARTTSSSPAFLTLPKATTRSACDRCSRGRHLSPVIVVHAAAGTASRKPRRARRGAIAAPGGGAHCRPLATSCWREALAKRAATLRLLSPRQCCRWRSTPWRWAAPGT